jgi:hypothetical protein
MVARKEAATPKNEALPVTQRRNMGNQSFFDKVREWLGGIAFRIFLWSVRMTQDEYLDAVAFPGHLKRCALRMGSDACTCVLVIQ